VTITAIDLFCGVGGLTHGLVRAGIPVIAGFDLDESCRYAYETNNESTFYCRDITEITGEEINDLYPEDCTKILVGCAPCQPFSPHTQKYPERDEREDWRLLYSFSHLIDEVRPEIVSMENVYEISRTQVFQDFLANLTGLEYHVFWKKVYCPDYGISQTRKRLVLLASRLGDIELIPPTHTPEEYPTVWQTIGNLPPIVAGEMHPTDHLHRTSALRALNLRRIMQSLPGRTWRDWDEELLSPCHRRETGRSYSGVYARMAPNAIGPTITTQFYNYGTGRFGHPEQNRALSLREGALFQTFPPDYDFLDPDIKFSIKRIGTHIGNAVPVNLGYAIGSSIFRHLGEVVNERECRQG
jgi:DNA (cytosine-5)-methyltransferase 1